MTNKISLRKIILLSLIAILLVVYILQLVISGANDGYTLSLKEVPDTIVIKNKTNSEITLFNTNGTWLLKDANENSENANLIIPSKCWKKDSLPRIIPFLMESFIRYRYSVQNQRLPSRV